ncbi:MAG: ribosome biogenesis/translation initiation ATPase RLI [Candidatus Hydrothermarchaeota archaeon]
MRIAVLDKDTCQPKKCSYECVKYCPGVRMKEETVIIDEKTGKPIISEELCSGCGICIKRCPFESITVINLPEELEEESIHRYGLNQFKLYGLPYPLESGVVGLIGPNGIGKTTAINILSGEIKPNLGRFEDPPDWDEVILSFRGSEIQKYLENLSKGKIKAIHKPQYIEGLSRAVSGCVKDLLKNIDERDQLKNLIEMLDLESFLNKDIKELSGGELQRVAISACLLKEGDVYLIDEPSSYLDVRQRVNVARAIQELAKEKMVVVVEHDLVILDWICDYVQILYGKPGVYGIITHPKSVRVGINEYLEGYLREENVRFRKERVTFEIRPPSRPTEGEELLTYPKLTKKYDGFSLKCNAGSLIKREIVGVLGPNAIGKTTFVKMLAGVLKPSTGTLDLNIKVSYKPQYLSPEYEETVLELLSKVTKEFGTSRYENEILKPLQLEKLLNQRINELSGGELQRVAIALCLSREADIYLLDEPSAYLDVEQRISLTKMLRRLMEQREKTALVVDHDVLLIDYLSDRIMIFDGYPGIQGESIGPLEKRDGMNHFLRKMNITFRRDKETGRPRINKEGSKLDREQKMAGEYYYVIS